MSSDERNNGLKTILACFTGLIAGAALGLLYAPSRGEETRKKIRSTSTDVKNQVVELAQQTIGAIKGRAQTLRPCQDNTTDNGDETTEET